MILDSETIITPYQYRHHTFHAFEYRGKQCILVPMPHPDMKHSWILHYDDIRYTFSTTRYGEGHPFETQIAFHRKGRNVYNVYLPEGYWVLSKRTVGDLCFLEMPNPNFTYLVAIPI